MRLLNVTSLIAILVFAGKAYSMTEYRVSMDDSVKTLTQISDINLSGSSGKNELSFIVTSTRSCKVGLLLLVRAYDNKGIVIDESSIVILSPEQDQRNLKKVVLDNGSSLHRVEFAKARCE